MSEYMEKHSVSKIIVRLDIFESGGQLTEAVRKILFINTLMK